ncbi:MAG TPA: hypothetical protein VKR06_34920, partial [Ktedonosporobacter sp.]|nr:hypothetical protein [Ktedonosporobacter sp.]
MRKSMHSGPLADPEVEIQDGDAFEDDFEVEICDLDNVHIVEQASPPHIGRAYSLFEDRAASLSEGSSSSNVGPLADLNSSKRVGGSLVDLGGSRGTIGQTSGRK